MIYEPISKGIFVAPIVGNLVDRIGHHVKICILAAVSYPDEWCVPQITWSVDGVDRRLSVLVISGRESSHIHLIAFAGSGAGSDDQSRVLGTRVSSEEHWHFLWNIGNLGWNRLHCGQHDFWTLV